MRRNVLRTHGWVMRRSLGRYLRRHTRSVLHGMRHLRRWAVLREERRIDVRSWTLRRPLRRSARRSAHRRRTARTHVWSLHMGRTLVRRESLLHRRTTPVRSHLTRLWTLLRHTSRRHLPLWRPLELQRKIFGYSQKYTSIPQVTLKIKTHHWRPRRSLTWWWSARSHVWPHIRGHIVRRAVESGPVPLWLRLETRRLTLRRTVIARRRTLHSRSPRIHRGSHGGVHRHSATEILVGTWGKVIIRMAGMLGSGVVICRRGTGFRLTFKVTQSHFSGKGYDRILTVDFFFRQLLHADPHAGFRSKRYDAESFGLTVGTVLKEFNLIEIIRSYVSDSIGNVLICCPLEMTKRFKKL